MSNSFWRERIPGNLGERITTEHIPEIDQHAILTYNNIPDWVRRPDTGEQLRVLDHGELNITCPMCKAEVTGNALALEQNVTVLDCPACKQFVFMRLSCKKGP